MRRRTVAILVLLPLSAVLASCAGAPDTVELTRQSASDAADAVVAMYETSAQRGTWQEYCEFSSAEVAACVRDASEWAHDRGWLVDASTVKATLSDVTAESIKVTFTGNYTNGNSFTSQTKAVIDDNAIKLENAVFWVPRVAVTGDLIRATPQPTP